MASGREEVPQLADSHLSGLGQPHHFYWLWPGVFRLGSV